MVGSFWAKSLLFQPGWLARRDPMTLCLNCFKLSLLIWELNEFFEGLKCLNFISVIWPLVTEGNGQCALGKPRAPGTKVVKKWILDQGLGFWFWIVVLGSTIITSWICLFLKNKRGCYFPLFLTENYGQGSQFTEWQLSRVIASSFLRCTERWVLIFTVDQWMPELERELVQTQPTDHQHLLCFFSAFPHWLVKGSMHKSTWVSIHPAAPFRLPATGLSIPYCLERYEIVCGTTFPWIISLPDLGRPNVNLLRWASSREAGLSGKPLPCPWADRRLCHRPSWLSVAWESPGSSGPGDLEPTVIDHYCTWATSLHRVAISFIKFHFTGLEDRHWLSGTGRDAGPLLLAGLSPTALQVLVSSRFLVGFSILCFGCQCYRLVSGPLTKSLQKHSDLTLFLDGLQVTPSHVLSLLY